MASAYLDLDDQPNAIEYFKQSFVIDPENLDTYLNLISIYQK